MPGTFYKVLLGAILQGLDSLNMTLRVLVLKLEFLISFTESLSVRSQAGGPRMDGASSLTAERSLAACALPGEGWP